MSKHIPVYAPLVQSIRAQITSGEIEPGFMVGTEIELAEKNGISRNSAREATSLLVKEGLVERRAGKGIFVRDHISSLVMEIILPCTATWSGGPVEGALAAAREIKAKVQIFNADGNFEEDLRAVRRLPLMKVDGAIVISVHHIQLSQQVIELHQAGFPLVLVDQRLRDVDVSSVTYDDLSGGELAASHLLSRGHRRIGFVGFQHVDDLPSGRQEGYRRALGDAGIAVDRSLEALYPYSSLVEPAEGDGLLRDLLTRPDRPEALVVQNPNLAKNTLRLMDELGLDLTLITFASRQKIERADRRLLFVELFEDQLGSEAVRLLSERIAHPEAPCRHSVVKMKLAQTT